MDLDLSDDQELLAQTTLRFIEAECPLDRVRETADGGEDVGADYRLRAGELGWFAMLVPEELGGGSVSDNGLFDAAVIAYARGANLQPGAFVGTNVVACALANEGSADQQAKVLPKLLSGEESATWAAAGPAGEWDAGAGMHASTAAAGFVLRGTKSAVHDAHVADWLLVTAQSDRGLLQLLVARDTPGVTVTRLSGLDLTRTFCNVTFDDVEVPASSLVGEVGAADDLAEAQLRIACVLTVAESLGAMDHDFDLALQYARDRVAFGRPIGSFQAVKHLLADTSLELEMSKGIATGAAHAVGGGRDDAGEVASMAKAFVADCGVDLAHNCFQVFGGIGYTWEHDQHLYLRRLTVDAALYGDAAWHRERVCVFGGL
jgi:alkylation response protein AidB-like acyl-CoA dehydrogenase